MQAQVTIFVQLEGDSWRGLVALPGELSSQSSLQRGLLRAAASWQSPCTTAASTSRVGGAGARHHQAQFRRNWPAAHGLRIWSRHCAPVGYGQAASRRRRASGQGGGDRPSPRGHGGGIQHRHEACSDLRVVINTPSTRGTFLQVGPIFLVLLITTIYACLLVACWPRSAVVCSAGAAELPEFTPV